MPKHVAGRLKEVIYAHFEPNEDLMIGIKQVVVERKIRTGLVLSITGGLTKARMSYFPHAGPLETTAIKVFEIPGPLEASGHGVIGMKVKDGSPYVHVHLDVTNGDYAIMGHLEEGTFVRSLYPTSHFTIAMASVEGVSFKLLEDEEARKAHPERFPVGVLYHELAEA
jgi:predicted DNA-binding protein with PD1-like motif